MTGQAMEEEEVHDKGSFKRDVDSHGAVSINQ